VPSYDSRNAHCYSVYLDCSQCEEEVPMLPVLRHILMIAGNAHCYSVYLDCSQCEEEVPMLPVLRHILMIPGNAHSYQFTLTAASLKKKFQCFPYSVTFSWYPAMLTPISLPWLQPVWRRSSNASRTPSHSHDTRQCSLLSVYLDCSQCEEEVPMLPVLRHILMIPGNAHRYTVLRLLVAGL
jgi:hypothetical protein